MIFFYSFGMSKKSLQLDRIYQGDCIEILKSLPEESVDLIFADPPYNLQLNQELWRPNLTRVDAVDDSWDRFQDFKAYDDFSRDWLSGCQRVLKKHGSIWVIGTYHNIFRLGNLMQDLGFWFLNDIVWIKSNPMPNFRGVRFTNAHEILIWACKEKRGKYSFNYHAMKALNEGLQMRSDWLIPICTGEERIKVNGKKAHSTQKPEALLFRVILSSSSPSDIILDPFFGTGTTGAVAKKLHRHWVGIEENPEYIEIASERIDRIMPAEFSPSIFDIRDKKRHRQRIPFGMLVENGMLNPGQSLYFNGDKKIGAVIRADSKLIMNDFVGSIHQVGKQISQGKPCNGWEHWYFEAENGELKKIDELRVELLSSFENNSGDVNCQE
jgi:site-specific DNA-methyltransferase (adenine-specific)